MHSSVGLRVLGAALAALALSAGPSAASAAVPRGGGAQDDAKKEAKKKVDVVVEEILVGKGRTAYFGDKATIHYTGTLVDGKPFDSSRGRQPLTFRLGEGEVIRGLEKGLVGMRVGGKRKITIPPELGYGKRGSPKSIPPNATLVFEVELIRVQ